MTVLAHGCPVQAIVAAFGFDERTGADWWARSGRQGQVGHAYLVEQPRDLGQVQADELRVKKQGGIVWMALAMLVTTRLWLGGEVSEQRDVPLIRRLTARVRRCAARRALLGCPDGVVSSIRAMRETCRDPVHTGTGGRPRRRPWRHVLIAQVLKRYERRRVVETERRMVDGTPARGDAQPPVARGRGDQYGVHGAAQRDVSGTPRAAGAPVPGAGTQPRHCMRGWSWWARSITFAHRIRFVSDTEDDAAMAAGITGHCWTMHALLSFHVPRPAGHHRSGEGVLPDTATPDQTMVRVTTVNCGATLGIHVPWQYNRS